MKTLMVPIDGSVLSERVLPHAAKLAGALGGKLILLRATYAHWLEQPTQAELAALAEKVPAEGFEIATEIYRVYHDDMARAICEAAVERQADLIVMSTHGRSGFGRWIYGSVAESVLQQSTVPVMLISAACEATWPTERPPRIAVTLDGSGLAEAALGPAVELAKALGAELTLIFITYGVEDEGAPTYLESLAEDLEVPTRGIARPGGTASPGASIAAVARDESIDLIVMATHGDGGIARFALGSVATVTLHHASVPLLLVRPAEVRKSETASTPAGVTA